VRPHWGTVIPFEKSVLNFLSSPALSSFQITKRANTATTGSPMRLHLHTTYNHKHREVLIMFVVVFLLRVAVLCGGSLVVPHNGSRSIEDVL
jgi:hypothetical protein